MPLKYLLPLVVCLAGCSPPTVFDAAAEAKVKQHTARLLAAQRGKTSAAMRDFSLRKAAPKELEMH